MGAEWKAGATEAMSTVTYNGITISDVLTEHIEQTIERESTGVDPIGVRVNVSVRGIVHLTQGATLGLAVGPNLAAGLSTATASLMHPRKRFTMTVAGATLFDIYPGATENNQAPAPDLGKMDVANGPTPKLEVLQINGDRSMRVRFSVEFVVPNCPGGSLAAGYLNLRFWVADDIDCKDWTTTRTYQGVLRTFHKLEDPKAFRNLVFPPLQRGFKRHTIALHESTDGLSLQFTIVDKEEWAVPPSPATDWDGQFTIAAPGTASEPMGYAELRFSLSGPKSVPKLDLATLAVKIMDAKLHLIDGINNNSIFADSITFSEELRANTIHAYARVRHIGLKSNATVANNFLNNFASEFGKPLALAGYNKEIASLPTPTATLTGLFLSRLQTPCNPASMPQDTDNFEPDDLPPEPESPTQVFTSTGDQPYYSDSYSSSHYQAPYSLSAISSSYDVDEANCIMPYGKTTSPSADTSLMVPLHRPVCRREVRIEAARLGKWPENPGRSSFTDDNGIEHRLLTWHPMPCPPQLSADGVKGLHRCDFVATYSLSRPPQSGDKLSVGSLPYHVTDFRGGVDWRNIAESFFVSPKSMLG